MTYCGPPRHPSVKTLCRVVSLRIAKQVEVNLAWLRNGGWHVAQAQFTPVIHLPMGSPPKQAIIQGVRDKTITSEEADKLIQDAVKYPTRLSATVARLPLEDAIDGWNTASQQEKKALRQTMLGKVSGFEKNVTERRKTIEEFGALKPKITQF